MKTTSGTYLGLGGLAVGAGLMYWLDPLGGRRRRALAREKAGHLLLEAEKGADISSRDMAHRAHGLLAKTRATLRREHPANQVIHDRVRARLGRYCSHPGAINVEVHDGTVVLKGPIFEAELTHVLENVARVKGVKHVETQLEPHATSDHVPALQGAGWAAGERFELMQRHWSPTARVLVGALATGLTAYGLGKRDLLGLGAGALGAPLLTRSVTNLETRRLTGVGAGHRAIDVQKTIEIEAPAGDVFAYLTEFENFPRFMSHIRSIKPLGNNRWRWSVEGPARIPVEWDVEVHELVPPEVIAWRSVEHSTVKSAGIVKFEDYDGVTRVSVRMAYNPPGGAIGHALAKLMGRSPKKELDDDMLRFKSLVERGKATGREGTVTREVLEAEETPASRQ